MLTKEQRSVLLNKLAAEIVAQNEIIAHAQAVLPAERMPDPSDIATVEESHRVAATSMWRAEAYKGRLIQRRHAIEGGDCCECQECGEGIPFQRLLLEPTATLCVPCKDTRSQMQERQYGIRPGMRVLAQI